MKTAFRFLFAFTFTFILLINGCEKDDDPTGPSSEKNFTFAKVGNKWVYKMTYNNSTAPDVTLEIVESKPNNVYKVANTYPETTWETVFTYWYVDGSKMAFNCDSTGTFKNFYIDENVPLNQEKMSIVKYSPFFNKGDTVYTKITSFDKPVTVPAGTFNCIEILVWGTESNDFPLTTVYISRTAGEIKQTNETLSGGMRLELKAKNF